MKKIECFIRPEKLDVSDLGFSLQAVPKRYNMARMNEYCQKHCNMQSQTK